MAWWSEPACECGGRCSGGSREDREQEKGRGGRRERWRERWRTAGAWLPRVALSLSGSREGETENPNRRHPAGVRCSQVLSCEVNSAHLAAFLRKRSVAKFRIGAVRARSSLREGRECDGTGWRKCLEETSFAVSPASRTKQYRRIFPSCFSFFLLPVSLLLISSFRFCFSIKEVFLYLTSCEFFLSTEIKPT